jgi:flagellin
MRNANDGVSMLQTVEGGLGRLSENLQRIRELAVQSANGIISNDDRQYLQAEVDQLQQEIARLVENTKFNDVTLFDSSLPETLTFQIGPDSTDTIDVETASYDLTALSTYAEADIGTAEKAADLIDAIDADLDAVNSARASSGAVQSRFETIVMQLQVFAENTAAARSRIKDADYAQETANLARAQILQQAGSAMLSQANAQPQMVLQLLQSVG